MNRRFDGLFGIALLAICSIAELQSSEGIGKTSSVLPDVPTAITSFGAEVLNGWVYVYGGHIGRAHKYTVDTTLGDFMRLKLDGGEKWESLPGGSRAQGTRLLAYKGSIYRVGGLQPRDDADGHVGLYSLDEFARFDVAEGKWHSLPPMPKGRSSHEAVIVGSTVVVGGGWNMAGEAGGKFWYDSLYTIDLEADELKWEERSQPFQRRAVSAASVGNKIYFIGGMDSDNDPSREVDVYDLATREWEEGPMIPRGPMLGFGSAACRVDGRLIVSPYSAEIHGLSVDGKVWETLGKLTERRFFHRIVQSSKGELLAIAGASRDAGHLATLEIVKWD